MHNHCISHELKSTKTEVFIIHAQQRLQDNLIICGLILNNYRKGRLILSPKPD